MELLARVKAVLEEMPGLQDIQVDLERTASGRVGGVMVSPSFAGKPQIDRQNLLWAYLDDTLPMEDRVRIVSVLTLTPEELADAA